MTESIVADLVCPKCQSDVEAGFVLDRGHAGSLYPSTWVEGAIRRNWLTGIEIRRRRQIAVVTYRGIACGYLESYAKGEPEKPS